MKFVSRVMILVLGLVIMGVVLAASPHFVRGPTASLTSDGDAVISWKEAGLGDTTTVHYVASADVSGLYQCVNKGGNCPSAANKQEFHGPVFAEGTFASGKNGSITASLTLQAPDPTLQCPGKQRVELVRVTFANMALESSASGAAAVDPSTLSVSGFECP